MNTTSLIAVYDSLLESLKENITEHEFKSESDKHIAGFIFEDIKKNSKEISYNLCKLIDILNK